MTGSRIVRAMSRSHRVASWVWAVSFAVVVMHAIG
jgi:hypothetical protein